MPMTDIETIRADLAQLTQDELAAIRFILNRILVVGRASYAPWQAKDETRDMTKEAADEGGDLCVYAGFGAVLKHVKRQRLIAEFKQLRLNMEDDCDHSEHLVLDDRCMGCGKTLFADFDDSEPTQSWTGISNDGSPESAPDIVFSAVFVSPDFDCDECGQARDTLHLDSCSFAQVLPGKVGAA